MPRRSAIDLETIASLDTLGAAFWRAARGKRLSPEVARMEQRRILAPCFPDRVVHHAMMAHMGPVLDRGLVDDTYACRTGKGTHAAARRAQEHLRRFPWFVKVDMSAYFASIDHGILLTLLRRRFKHPAVLALCERVLARTPDEPGRGLPIGALTSQHFANAYLDVVDRFLLETLRVRGLVRYMDDLLWWCNSREEARDQLAAVRHFAWKTRRLAVKPTAQIGRSERGVSFLGFRVLVGTLRLLRRRRRRYAQARARWERAYVRGEVDAHGLQAGVDAALAITAHADASGWRRRQLERCPPVDA